MLSTLCSFRKTPPPWANSFAHPGVFPNPFGSDNQTPDTRHQTPDNWQAAIIRQMRHCWASFGWTCRHLHFRMTRIRKRRFCKARNSASVGKKSTATQPLLTRRAPPLLATSASVARQKKQGQIRVWTAMCFARYGRTIAILWHFARTTCLFVLKIAGSGRHREARLWRCPPTIEAKVEEKKPVVFEIPDI